MKIPSTILGLMATAALSACTSTAPAGEPQYPGGARSNSNREQTGASCAIGQAPPERPSEAAPSSPPSHETPTPTSGVDGGVPLQLPEGEWCPLCGIG